MPDDTNHSSTPLLSEKQNHHSDPYLKTTSVGSENPHFGDHQNNNIQGTDIEQNSMNSSHKIEDQYVSLQQTPHENEPISELKNSIDYLESPFKRYNKVILEYNNPINTINNISLQPLRESKFFAFIYKLFLKPSNKVFLIPIFLIASGLNILMFFVLLSAYVIYFLEAKTFDQNDKKIPDPFLKMIFSEEICQTLNTHTHYFRIDVNEMGNFSFNFDTMNFIKEKIVDSVVEFMVYDVVFFENYAQFHKVKFRFTRWILGSLLLIGMNALIVFVVYILWLKDYF